MTKNVLTTSNIKNKTNMRLCCNSQKFGLKFAGSFTKQFYWNFNTFIQISSLYKFPFFFIIRHFNIFCLIQFFIDAHMLIKKKHNFEL